MAVTVKATERGYYGRLREEGDVFAIRSEKEFSERWMVKVKARPKRRAAAPEPEPEVVEEDDEPDPDEDAEDEEEV